MIGSILADTNVLLRVVHTDADGHATVLNSLDLLITSGFGIAFTPQSLREFWNVSTRSSSQNGFGKTVRDADRCAQIIERNFIILHDTADMHAEWRRLVVRHEVKGIQVHDARLAASAIVGGCRAILTLNDPDFKRFGVEPLHPRDVAGFLGA